MFTHFHPELTLACMQLAGVHEHCVCVAEACVSSMQASVRVQTHVLLRHADTTYVDKYLGAST